MSEKCQRCTLDFEKAPAYSVLFHLGKKSMRPGGVGLTQRMLHELKIAAHDEVIELAPGRGLTTKMVLDLNPRSYIAVERDPISQQSVQEILNTREQGQCVVGTAQATGLPDESATVVFGEAMLTMQSNENKLQIAREVFRLLKPGGRYGIHETCLQNTPGTQEKKSEIEKALREALRVGARPLFVHEWQELLADAGFAVQNVAEASMSLLSPKRLIQDEGLFGALLFISKVVRSAGAPRRLKKIRGTFARYAHYMNAAILIAEKPRR